MADKKSTVSPEDILVGGQAVIEGVMMRTPHAYAVAVRRADGSVEVKREPVKRLSEYWKPLSWVIVRGFAVLIQSLFLGMRTLNFSINASMADLESGGKEKPKKAAKGWRHPSGYLFHGFGRWRGCIPLYSAAALDYKLAARLYPCRA